MLNKCILISDLLESNQLPFDNHKAGTAKLLQSNALPNELKPDFIIAIDIINTVLSVCC